MNASLNDNNSSRCKKSCNSKSEQSHISNVSHSRSNTLIPRRIRPSPNRMRPSGLPPWDISRDHPSIFPLLASFGEKLMTPSICTTFIRNSWLHEENLKRWHILILPRYQRYHPGWTEREGKAQIFSSRFVCQDGPYHMGHPSSFEISSAFSYMNPAMQESISACVNLPPTKVKRASAREKCHFKARKSYEAAAHSAIINRKCVLSRSPDVTLMFKGHDTAGNGKRAWGDFLGNCICENMGNA